jgi:peptide-methionine (S)-S-oxide reductase
MMKTMSDQLEATTLGAGCFWCVEAVFLELKGVHEVISGYAGGTVQNPSYQQVCTGMTGHAEVVQITFDPGVISFSDLLHVFWRTHDPTTLNRQGADVGTQYRSAIIYHNEKQKTGAENSKRETDAAGLWQNPIVTEIVPAAEFYVAEEYHQNYYALNSYQPYCQIAINPKLEKLKKEFGNKLKNSP